MSSSSTPWKPPLTSGSSSRSRQPGQPAARPRTSPLRPPPSARNRRCGSRGPSVGAGAAPRGTAGAPATRRWSSVCVCGGDTGGSAERPRVPTAPHGPAVPPYLQATLAGAHDGAEVAGGAARAALGRRPQQVEGAAVTGALGAFAGDTGIEDMGVAVPKAALSRAVLCPQRWHPPLQHGGHGSGCPQSEDPECHPPCGTAVCEDRSWGAARMLLPPARSPAVAPTQARWDTHTGYGGGSSHSKVPKDTTLPVHKDSAWGHLGGRI